jgi:hypothetical protein
MCRSFLGGACGCEATFHLNLKGLAIWIELDIEIEVPRFKVVAEKARTIRVARWR